ncbi:PREDICTED: uncharacterized protein LOC103085762 [Lipotes vexillifer]|uniref:Uncharacterized protein LOC103085762 n=1 Tax=Lipotes vexillifer TaxID=118797 RepID=A0A340YAR6_LIPVE|nr:PREDICTED: uncharacterized protein LOC103085762 [Lipotes vexillifer]
MPGATSAHSPEQTKQGAGCSQALASANYAQITQQSCPERSGGESPDSSVRRQLLEATQGLQAEGQTPALPLGPASFPSPTLDPSLRPTPPTRQGISPGRNLGLIGFSFLALLDGSRRCAELQVHVTEVMATAAEQRDLIARLEQDLSTIQSIQRPDAEVSPPPTLPPYHLPRALSSSLNTGSPNCPTCSLPPICLAPWKAVLNAQYGGASLTCSSHLQGAAELGLEKIPEPIKEATALFYGPSAPASSTLPEGQVDSLLSIISSQRERFRARNQELEAENRLAQHTIQALQSELDSLRADNIKLFEKIKFLQSYPGRGGGSDDTELRYSTQYEERLDPFSSFSKRPPTLHPDTPDHQGSPQARYGTVKARGPPGERQRKYLSLSPWDKATLSMGGGSDDTELRYSTQYEERLDPFSSFSKRPPTLHPDTPDHQGSPQARYGTVKARGPPGERQRKYLSLSPWDKATLSMGRLVLSNKMARTIGFCYTLFLHCLVFLVLYKLAWSESVERDCATFCAKKFADHLHKFHENDNGAAAGDLWQ